MSDLFTQEKPKMWVAIDPGKQGAIVGLTEHKVLFKKEMPLIGDDIDVLKLHEIIDYCNVKYNATLIIEDVHSIFGVSASNNFVFGWVCGQIDAIIVFSKVKHHYIQPKFWQKNIWTSADMVYKPLKKDQKKPSVDTKASSLNAVRRLFPAEDLRGHIEVKHYGDTPENRKLKRVGDEIPTKRANAKDGIVDALLMCEMARRLNY